MEFWYLTDISRLSNERNEMQRLEESSTWLKGTEWRIESRLVVRAIIMAHEQIYELQLTYPDFFPATPPFISPVNTDDRWSEHQYSNGTLCLEWGPDNWHPDVTGAQMFESAYKLLNAENPLGESTTKAMVPSRHFLTPGQSIRGEGWRFHMTKPILNYLSVYEEKTVGQVTMKYVVSTGKIVYHAVQINQFINEQLPAPFKNGYSKEQWIIYRTTAPTKSISGVKKTKELFDVIKTYDGYELKLSEDENGEMTKGIILIDKESISHFFYFFEESIHEVVIVMDDIPNKRIPDSCLEMIGKRFAIIGLGSVGSKVAESLCRMGATTFYLVDEDLFLLGNLERHTLDWRDLGLHKVDAIAQRMRYISSSVDIKTSRLNLNGQESNASLNGVLVEISNCDVIIDATANGQVFNLLASIATTKQKPIIWTEVYAGGIGGLIARSRPILDPKPHIMRQAYQEFASSSPPFEFSEPIPYAHENEAGQVFIASDADVSVIASHMTRFVVDTIVAPEKSIFPYSMYVIGLTKGWIFSQPFDTKPIQTEHLLSDDGSTIVVDEATKADHISFLINLLEKSDD
ncbi:ThiF family adenylyltransferase [Paenibacillus piscarius]|uniref:ThiF family adenylyltransferase n=1 Tax=Paenibacillus piscarius TaxID=1089681 RepID=UPI001EE7F5A5|nr:ThiF family adenylyltransferase [Paenibacillus piscarius]